MLSKEEIERALPANLKTAATQELADTVNNVVSDPIEAQHIRDNFIGYVNVLQQGRFNTKDYLNAVVYVSYKLMGYSNREAYEKTFPGRMHDLISNGVPSNQIAAYVSIYNKGKLVNLIYQQSLIPVWVLNQDMVQRAINVQADLMINSQSDKVRCEAANSILTHLKKPEVKEFQISMEQKENSGMTELKDLLKDLAREQIKHIEEGTPTRDIAAKPLITHVVEAEFDEVEPDAAD